MCLRARPFVLLRTASAKAHVPLPQCAVLSRGSFASRPLRVASAFLTLYLRDLCRRQPRDAGWQGLEVDCVQETGRAAAGGVDRPVQEGLDSLGLDEVGLLRRDNRVLVV